MENNFYSMGQLDSLRNLPANPPGAGANSPKKYNDYMNGYNSVPQTTYAETLQSISKLMEDHKARQSKEGLALVLSKLLIRSLGEPAESKTETDALFRDYLDLLETHEAYELKKGFTELYNAVQKSKSFVLKPGISTKQLVFKKDKKDKVTSRHINT